MKAHPSRYWIWISLLLGLHLAGCSTSKEEMLPHGDHTMLDIWNGGGSVGTQQQLREARGELRRPVLDPERLINAQSAYTRTAANEIRTQFPRLPNPDLVMYVYPHLAGPNRRRCLAIRPCSRCTRRSSTRCPASAWTICDG